jgi:hypothetical protein
MIPKTRRLSSKGMKHNRSPQSTPSASPSRSSSPSSRVEQSFDLSSNGQSTPWLSLRVRSNASPSKAHPLYFDGDTVEGSVHLNSSENPTNIVAVMVIVSSHPRASSVSVAHLCVGPRPGLLCRIRSSAIFRAISNAMVNFQQEL